MFFCFPVEPRKRLHVFSFILFLIGTLLPSLAAAETATVTFDASGDGGPVVNATNVTTGDQLTSPAVVNGGDVVDFEWNTPGLVHRGLAEMPNGCGASFVSGHKWTATIIGDCSIHFETMYLNTSPYNGMWNLTEGSDFRLKFEASYGVGIPIFSLGSGSLPRGMSLDASGLVSGIPIERGVFDFTVKFDDGYGGTGYSGPLRFAVNAASPALANPVSATVDYGSSDNLIALDITGGTPTSVDVASSPSHGVATASGTEIRYTPTAGYSGSDSFTYTATNSSGTSAPATVSITVGPAPTHTVSWTSSGPGTIGPVSFLDNSTMPIISPVTVSDGRIISFWFPLPDTGATYREPSGCGIHPVGGVAWYTDPITADCAVSIIFEEITFSNDTLPGATKDASYNTAITATGGYLDFTYSLASGALPEGLDLSEDGTIVGVPTETGDFTFVVRARNERRHFQTKSYSLTVEDAPEPTVSWSLSPDDLSLISARVDGSVISSGDSVPLNSIVEFRVRPRSAQTYSDAPNGCGVTYQGSDATGNLWRTSPVTADCAVTFPINWIVIKPNNYREFLATKGQAYSLQFTTERGYGPFADWSWTLVGALPTGIDFNEQTGELSGVPEETGSFSFDVTATNGVGHSDTEGPYEVIVSADNASLSALALSEGTLSPGFDSETTAYFTLVAYETGSLTVTPTAEDPAATITVNGQTVGSGEASPGIPLTVVDTTITVEVTAQDGSKTRTYTVLVRRESPVITIGPDNLPDGSVGVPYGPVSFTAEGGLEPYTFVFGVLPPGLEIDTNGSLTGTPTAAGNFSFGVKATDATGFFGAKAFTISINAPVVDVSIPLLPDGKVNTAYPTIQLSASGGAEPYEFAVTAGSLPGGIELATDGTLSGTPNESGDFAATVTATDQYGFTGTTNLSIRIKALDVPVAQDMTLEVMAGTTASVDLTRGATNGPFTAADIVVHPTNEAGKASVRESGTVYLLDFAAAGAFAGSASLQYTLSNADGRSAPATVTLNVIARPDPSQDPEVIGLLTAQTETAKRFAKTQIDNFNRRLEQLHDEGDRRRNSMDVNIGMTERDSDMTAYAEEDQERDPVTDAFRRMDGSNKKNENPASGQDRYNPLGNFAIWTGGYVNFAEADNGGIDLDSTLVGVSGGVDYRFSSKFVAGLGFGYGRDKTDIGDNGTESRGRAWSMAAYGSYKPMPNIFIDGLLGYGFMDFDSRRFVTANGDFATGSRGGRQVFGSLTAGYEHRQDSWLVSPYGRLEASRSKLDGFTESGGGIYGLTYGDQTIDTLSGVLGLRLEYAMPMDWGVLKPRARLEYTHDFEGSSRVSLGYTDIGTMPYGIDIDPFSRDYLTIGLGFDTEVGDGWNLGFDYRTAYGSGGNSRVHSFAIKVGASF